MVTGALTVVRNPSCTRRQHCQGTKLVFRNMPVSRSRPAPSAAQCRQLSEQTERCPVVPETLFGF